MLYLFIIHRSARIRIVWLRLHIGLMISQQKHAVILWAYDNVVRVLSLFFKLEMVPKFSQCAKIWFFVLCIREFELQLCLVFMNDAISDTRGERDSFFEITRYFDWLQGLLQDLSQILGLLTSHYYEYRNASISLKITLQCKDKFCSATDNIWLKTDGKYLRGKMFWGVWLQFSTSQIFLQVKLQKQKFFFFYKCEFNEHLGTQFKFSSSFKKSSKGILCNSPSHY